MKHKEVCSTMHVILTGATGLVGSAILRRLSIDPSISRISVITRRPLREKQHDKVVVIFHDDFAKYPEQHAQALRTANACIWAIGTSTSGVNELEYKRVTRDWPITFAEHLRKAHSSCLNIRSQIVFIYVSAIDASSSERGLMYQRIKGQAENDLKRLASRNIPGTDLIAVSVRPGGIIAGGPWIAQRHQGMSQKLVVQPLLRLLNCFLPSIVITATELAESIVLLCKSHEDDLPKEILPLKYAIVPNNALRKLSKRRMRIADLNWSA